MAAGGGGSLVTRKNKNKTPEIKYKTISQLDFNAMDVRHMDSTDWSRLSILTLRYMVPQEWLNWEK